MVTAAVKVYYYLAPNSRLNKIVKPLLRILHSDSKEIQAVVLADCAIIAKEKPVSVTTPARGLGLTCEITVFILRFCN